MAVANGRGTMRPTGRTPPFLAIGLFVALVILGFNYWNLSAKNGEQANEIAVMESEMRLVNAKKTAAEKRSEAISDKVNDLENDINTHKNTVADKMAMIATLNSKKDDLVRQKDAEIEQIRNEELKPCLERRDILNTELNKVNGELENEKNVPKQTECDVTGCSQFIVAARDLALEDVNKVAGSAPLLNMYKAGMNVGKFVTELQQLAQQGNVPQDQNPQAQQNQPEANQNEVANPNQPAAQDDKNQAPADTGAQDDQKQAPADTGAQGANNDASPNAKENDNVEIPDARDALKTTKKSPTGSETTEKNSAASTIAANSKSPALTSLTSNGEGAEALKKDELPTSKEIVGDGGDGDDDENGEVDEEDYEDEPRLTLEKQHGTYNHYEGDDKEDDNYAYNDKNDEKDNDIMKDENGIDEMQMQLEKDQPQ